MKLPERIFKLFFLIAIHKQKIVFLLPLVILLFLPGNILFAEDTSTTPTKIVLPPAPPKQCTQVRIHMKVLEWTTDITDEYGFRVLYMRLPGSSSIVDGMDMTFPMTSATDSGVRFFFDNMMSSAGSFEAVVECLEQFGSVEVLSEPNVICPIVKKFDAKDPYQAKITTGSKIPFEKAQPVGDTLAQVTDFRDLGVTLSVGVHDIIDEKYIKILVWINVKNLAGYISVGTNKQGNPLLVPELTSREIINNLLVENEKTLITGLLVNQSITSSGMGVPWISKVPVLGWFFRNRKSTNKRQELVFLLRPEIIYD